jgi:MYXO-CTERM domain-containing protein
MKAIWSLIAIVVLGSTVALAQTTNQQNSSAPNGTTGSYSGNTPANTPDRDGTTSNVPNSSRTDRTDTATSSPSTDTPREGRNFGWIGLLGLAGLAGLRGRSSHESRESVSRRAVA